MSNEKLFNIQALVFKHDKESNQWKQRGFGDLKLYFYKKSKVIIVEMRRLETRKLCANHCLFSGIKFYNHCENNNTLIYQCFNDIINNVQADLLIGYQFACEKTTEMVYEIFTECCKALKKNDLDDLKKDIVATEKKYSLEEKNLPLCLNEIDFEFLDTLDGNLKCCKPFQLSDVKDITEKMSKLKITPHKTNEKKCLDH